MLHIRQYITKRMNVIQLLPLFRGQSVYGDPELKQNLNLTNIYGSQAVFINTLQWYSVKKIPLKENNTHNTGQLVFLIVVSQSLTVLLCKKEKDIANVVLI